MKPTIRAEKIDELIAKLEPEPDTEWLIQFLRSELGYTPSQLNELLTID